MSKRLFFIVPLFLAYIIGPAAVHAAHLRGKIVRVGFPGSGTASTNRGMDCFRPGAWTPVLVELTNTDSDLFEGSIEIAQPDRDGDFATSTVPIALRGTRTYYVYVPAGSSEWQAVSFRARLLAANGAPIPLHDDRDKVVHHLYPTNEPHALPDDAQVILDISLRPINQLNDLVVDPLLVRELVITRLAPTELPDQVAGLEWVDTIVWDDPDPSGLDLSQRDALIEFVRRGGTLVLGVGKNWQSITHSALGEFLPATLTGTASSRQLPGLSDVLLGLPTADFDPPVTYCPVKSSSLAPNSTVIIPRDAGHDNELFLISRCVARGKSVLVTAQLSDLLARGEAGQNKIFLRDVLGLRREERNQENEYSQRDLFGYIEASTGFKVTSGLYFIFACLFVVAYIAIATGGSWTWLKRRQRLYQTWPAFAVIAVLASGASLAAVQIIRGIGIQVQQFSIVDAQARSADATATCYFGLKTASHQQLDLAVPVDSKNLRDAAPISGGLIPLPSAGRWDESTFSAGLPYQVVASLGQLRAVPMRATLKQFRGVWHGRLPGQLNAFLKYREPDSYRPHDDSWFDNQLGVDLEDCYLLTTLRNPGGGSDTKKSSRALNIGVFPIGKLAAGKKSTWKELGELRKRSVTESPDLPHLLLEQAQTQWLRAIHIQTDSYPGSSQNQRQEITSTELTSAMLLGTTWGELDLNVLTQHGTGLHLTRALELDRSAHLTKETALLIGFTEKEPGPARLCCRNTGTRTGGWRAIHPAEAKTVYRFAIPVVSSGEN